ncbi:hypothetical protein K1W54_07435 [Micromonospora sp. CPCC 205371]|nr:hypothetical protein [Micromonospora sp. CPCC 205371]
MSEPTTPLDSRNPLELAAASAALITATTVAAALFPAADTSARLVVMAIAVGGCAALTRARTALSTAGLGYLLFTGFLVNTQGELTWDGTTSSWRLATITTATGLGQLCRWIQAARIEAAVDAELRQLLDEAASGRGNGHHPA